MNRIAALLGGALVAAGLSVGVYAHEGHHAESTEGKKVTVQGELVDTACFVTSDGDAKGKNHAQCASKCMASGIPAGILPQGSKDSDAVMFLLTDPKQLAQYAAQTIKVEGTAYEDKHSIDVKKLYVKEGNGWKEVMLMDEHHKMGGGADEHAGHQHAGTSK